MQIPRSPHSWSVTPKRAVEIQRKLAGRVVKTGRVRELTLVAGADLAFAQSTARAATRNPSDKGECIAGVVVWDVRSGEVVEQHAVRQPTRFPYVPGLLSFREAPAIVAVLRRLKCEPDVFMFDGQGLAHPRRFGLACHMGLLIDRPTLGCAKSLLVGTCDAPGSTKGSTTPLEHNGKRIGMALRTRDDVKPVFVSLGHRLALQAAVEITLACCTRYRLPEPTRLADQLVARKRKEF